MSITSYHIILGILVVILMAFTFAWGQTIEEDFIKNPCTTAKTCKECIHSSPLCSWCGAQIYSRELPRCDKIENLINHCDDKDIKNPTSTLQLITDRDLTDGDANQAPIQIKPQKLEIAIRPNEPKMFKLKFQQQPNYPVDLYFLLDLSYGMHRQSGVREHLISLGNEISSSMANITNNFRLGFGTFVDKLLMPYTAWTDQLLKNRCPYKNKQCIYPFDFKNYVSIGLNQSSFALNMKAALETVSQSLDDTEGGFDGLIQVLACNDVIGWRTASRRIIIYSSNSLFHLAGDGKFGGATKQNRLKCNLTSDGTYEADKIFDYPSVSQIAQMLRDNKANVIFAVMSNVLEYYRALENFLDGAVVGELQDDSKNIVGLIKDKYYELRSRIEFHPSKSEHIDVKFMSKCKSSKMVETTFCENLEIMDSVEFQVEITVNKDLCLNKVGMVTEKVILNAIGLNEAVEIHLDVRCSCDCETSSQIDVNSEKCSSGNGTFECGICSCNHGRFGKLCECDEADISREKSLNLCKQDQNDTLTCSGNGDCVCGVCECRAIFGKNLHKYSGLYCECNDYNCLLGKNKLLCGGQTNGKCNCGSCECLPGWTGDTCECTTNTDSCIADNGKVCNGSGICQCGRCVCDSSLGLYGPTCEDCLTCPSQCNEYLDCAQCKGFQSGSYGEKEECNENCKNFEIIKKGDLPSGEGIKSCSGTDTDKCTFFFTYEYTSTSEVILTIQETKDCPKEVPIVAIIAGTVSAVVLIPLILLCIFIFLRNLKDKKEYAAFQRDKAKAQWDQGANPLYKGPTTTFTNLNYKEPEEEPPNSPTSPSSTH